MLEKFHELRDETLVLMYKEKQSEDIELELISRYEIHSKKLASELFQKYRFLYQVEYDDLYCIILSQLFIAIGAMKVGNKSFYEYWKKLATHEANRYASQFSIDDNCKIFSLDMFNPERLSFFCDSADYHNEALNMQSHLTILFENHFDKFDKKERDILVLYIAGYSMKEIAEETGLKYSTVRIRLSRIKDKIADILLLS